MILETEQLVLRYTQQSDQQRLIDIIFSDAEVMAYLPYGRALTQEEALDFITSYFPTEKEHIGLFTIEEKKTGTVVGFAGCVPFSAMGQDDVEFGFGFGKAYWNSGYGTEIATAFNHYILEVVKYPRFMALVYPENAPSIHVLEKLGYQYIDTIDLPNRGERRVYYIDASSC